MSNADPSGNIPEFTLGDRLRKARKFGNVDVDELATILEVSDRTIRNYENEITPVKRKDVVLWAMRCGVNADWLWTGIARRDGDGDDGATVTMREPARFGQGMPRVLKLAAA